MKKVGSKWEIIFYVWAITLLIITAFLPLGLGDFVLPPWGGGVVHQDLQMAENIWLPAPTTNVGRLWYCHDLGGELFGTQGNGIVGNGRIAACSFLNIAYYLRIFNPNLNVGYHNLIIYDYYGNRIWSDDHILNPSATMSSPMIDIYDRVVACDNKTIILVNASNRENVHVEWNQSIPIGSFLRPLFTAPISPCIVEDKTIILPCNNGPVLAYNVHTGELLDKIYLGENVTIDPYWGIPEMNKSNRNILMYNYLFNSICPYRYNNTSHKIEWNSTVPYGIMPLKWSEFFDGTIKFIAYENNVTAYQRDGFLDWTILASNDIESGGYYTGKGYFSTINSVCIKGNRVFIATEYKKNLTIPVNKTIGRLYAIDVCPDLMNNSVRLVENWSYTYYGRSQASPTLINDTLYFDGYNDTALVGNRDPHIYAVYSNNGTLKWKRQYDNITWFTFTKDPRGGFWYEDCDQVFRIQTGGDKLVRFREDNGSIMEEIDLKSLLGDSEKVIPCSDMTICGSPTYPIMLISANHPHFKPGKWVLAINLSDNNNVTWKIPINSPLNRNYASGDYTILNESGEYRVLFPTNVGGVMAIGRYPNCWFDSISSKPWDSLLDYNNYNDSVNISFSIKTSVLQDHIWVKAMLISQDHPVLCLYKTEKNYTITPSGIQDNLTITLPSSAPKGMYDLKVYLYNSSGMFDRKLLPLPDFMDNGRYTNDTNEAEYYLYPPNDPPETPHQPWGDTQVLTNETPTYTSHTTDPNGDPLWYQWKYETRIGRFHFTYYTLLWDGPYASGVNCTRSIHWPFSGTYNVSVRAKDFLLNPNVMSNWSPPLQITISKSNKGATWNPDLLSAFTSAMIAENQHTSCTGFTAGVMEGNAQQGSLNWTWDFGDGNISYGENVSHSYSQKGNYTVNLTLKSDEGETSNFTTTISVDVLSANFNITGEEQPEKTVYFNDTSMSSSSLVNWSWDFGDGNSSYDQNTNHTYTEPGQYNVSLTVRDTLNNTQMYTKSVFIESVAPEFISVVDSPNLVGFGDEMTISTDFFDNQSGVESVMANITYPDNTTGYFSMKQNVSSEHDYVYVFNDTWQSGIYNYSIWIVDHANNTNYTSGFNFTVSAEATINIATLQDSYSGDEYINITDPPNPPMNLTVVGRGLTWNTYYNATSGNNILEVYQTPVNYQDDNGSWTPINSSLQSLATNHSAYVYGYRKGNDRGLFGVYFKPNAQNDWPIAFTYNRSDNPTTHVIRSKLIGVGYVDPASNWTYQYLQNVQSSQGQTTRNSITYNDVFTGTDVTWRYGNTGLKEEIILSNATKTLLQNHPPSQYGLHNASSYLVFITKLDYQNLNLYNKSGVLPGNVTISTGGVAFKDVLGRFKCALPLGEAYELNNESAREKLTYRIVHLNGNTYLLSGLKVSNLNMMTFPVIIDPTLTVYTNKSDGYLYNSGENYSTVWSAKEGTVSDTENFIAIGQTTGIILPENYSIYRGFLFFNTSSLPFNAIIDNATLNLYKKDDYSTTDFVITIQNGQPDYPKDPLGVGDYDKEHYDGDYESYSSGYGGGLNTTDFVDGINEIVLTKLDWINKGSITKLCLRSSRDINGTAPTGDEYITVYSADITQEIQSYVPQLIITYRNQSKIKNTGSTDLKGYLLIQVQYYDASHQIWIVDNDTVNETSLRTINTGDQLALDTIFNGMIRASDLIHGTGIYRVYAAFRDPDGNILKTSDETELKAWWQFSTT